MCRWICYFSLMIRDREAECELDEPTVDIMRWVIERERDNEIKLFECHGSPRVPFFSSLAGCTAPFSNKTTTQ